MSRTKLLALLVVIVLTATAVACDDQGSGDAATDGSTTPPTLPFDTPTKDELATAAGLAFPESTDGYQSVQIGPGQLDVKFTMAEADVDAFVSGSDLPALTNGKRTLSHSSPLWELNPTEPSAGSEVTRDGLTISVEVVGAGDPRTARVSVSAAAPE
jgi:hypothetical protein